MRREHLRTVLDEYHRAAVFRRWFPHESIKALTRLYEMTPESEEIDNYRIFECFFVRNGQVAPKMEEHTLQYYAFEGCIAAAYGTEAGKAPLPRAQAERALICLYTSRLFTREWFNFTMVEYQGREELAVKTLQAFCHKRLRPSQEHLNAIKGYVERITAKQRNCSSPANIADVTKVYLIFLGAQPAANVQSLWECFEGLLDINANIHIILAASILSHLIKKRNISWPISLLGKCFLSTALGNIREGRILARRNVPSKFDWFVSSVVDWFVSIFSTHKKSLAIYILKGIIPLEEVLSRQVSSDQAKMLAHPVIEEALFDNKLTINEVMQFTLEAFEKYITDRANQDGEITLEIKKAFEPKKRVSVTLHLIDSMYSVYEKVFAAIYDGEDSNVKISNFQRYTLIIIAGHRLEASGKRLVDFSGFNKLQSNRIHVVLNNATSGYGFNCDTLTYEGECPINMAPYEDPYTLTPGCRHVFETTGIFRHMRDVNTNCPLCRTPIEEVHLKLAR